MKKRIKHDKYKIWFAVSVGMLVFSIVGRAYYSNKLVVKNEELKELYLAKVSLEKQISGLQFKKSQLSSLSSVEERALALGFVPLSASLLSFDPNEPLPLASLPVQ